MGYQRRTDLAIEAQELFESSTEGQTSLSGVIASEEIEDGFSIHRVDIVDKEGATALGKPCGTYFTLTTTPFTTREEHSFPQGVDILGKLLSTLLQDLPPTAPVLVVGLGNRAITPDALGPLVWEHTLITRHLVTGAAEHFGEMRSVSAIAPGVLGTTGVETGEVVSSLVQSLAPSCVIAVDALASRSVERLCNTVQLSDTGISPGSGVGNHRSALNWETLGIPVIAIGVPTVVDGGTLAADLLDLDVPPQQTQSLFVTPRDIDRQVADFAKFIGYGINTALHPDLSMDDWAMLN